MKAREGMLTPQQQDNYAHLILQKMRQVENMVDQLHHLSTLDSTTYEPNREPFMFSELLLDVVTSFQRRGDGRAISITCNGCEDAAYINADISMIERVSQNLMANAVAYSPEKGEIGAELQREREGLILTIKNTSSLPQQIIPLMLETDLGTYSPLPQTLSLGLSIVKRILHIHHYPFVLRNDVATVVFEVRMDTFAMQRAQ